MEPSEVTNVALVQLCVDDRLDHGKIRKQVAQKIHDVYLRADRIFLLNEVGGNLGQNFRNTLELFLAGGARIVFCGILHHDDCAADRAGCRLPMEQTVVELYHYLGEKGVNCPVYTANIRTSDSTIEWTRVLEQLPRAA